MPRQTTYPVTELKESGPTDVSLFLEPAEMAGIASELELVDLAKTRFEGELVPMGRKNWQLRGKLGATVTQSCVLTLAPVKTRIDVPIERIYLADFELPDEDSVTEMDEDDDVSEPLPAEIDMISVISEAIALNVPAYPRAEGAELETQVFAPPGVDPLTDQDLKPFASLADLKDKLEKGG